MPTNSTSSTNVNPNSVLNPNGEDTPKINQDACKKYGITVSEPPVEPVEPYSRYNEDDTIYGFVTEVTHDQKGTEIEIKDWGFCLEENHIELGFDNMPNWYDQKKNLKEDMWYKSLPSQTSQECNITWFIK